MLEKLKTWLTGRPSNEELTRLFDKFVDDTATVGEAAKLERWADPAAMREAYALRDAGRKTDRRVEPHNGKGDDGAARYVDYSVYQPYGYDAPLLGADEHPPAPDEPAGEAPPSRAEPEVNPPAREEFHSPPPPPPPPSAPDYGGPHGSDGGSYGGGGGDFGGGASSSGGDF